MTRDRDNSPAPGRAREAALDVLRRLVDAGYQAYFAGGCVRDRLLGRVPKDYDVATDARPEQVRGVFAGSRGVGESFGVVIVRRRGHAIEVATFRTDGVYADGRRPDDVTYTDAEHDARRRDFTINGLFEDPLTNEIIDFVGGQADLAARLVRAIGDPAARLREDRLRMLRAVRFAAKFHFAIETETAETIRHAAADLGGVSRERIGQEVRWMLADPNRGVAAWELQYLGVDAPILDEPNQVAAPRRVGRLPDAAAYATALAAWALDRGDDDGTDPIERAGRWARALMLSNDERRATLRCLSIHRDLRRAWSRLGVAGQKRLASDEHFDEALRLLQAEDPQAFVDVRRRVLHLAESGLAPDPLITGDDLVELGLAPGPSFKHVLDGVYDAQLEGSVSGRDEAIALARDLHGRVGGDPTGRR